MDENIEKLELIDKISDQIDSNIMELLDLSNDSDEEVRMRAIEILGDMKTPEIEERVQKGLGDSDDLVRHSCLEIIGQWRDYSSKDLLIKALSDKSWLVKSEAAVILADLGVEEAKKEISQNINGAEDEEKVRYYYALTKLGESSYYTSFINNLNHEYYRIRCAVINLIPTLATNENVDTFKHLLYSFQKNEKSEAVLSTLQEVLDELEDPDFHFPGTK